jgi:hypothetical protein
MSELTASLGYVTRPLAFGTQVAEMSAGEAGCSSRLFRNRANWYASQVTVPIVLSVANVQWLQQLHGVVAANDLDVAYSFVHPLNQSRELTRESLAAGADDEHLLWWMKIYAANREEALDAPLARKVYRSMPLVSVRENGPVVYNALFQVKQSFKRQGLATKVYAAEGVLYKKWGVREIHMNAREDGLVVWVKGFGFLPQSPPSLATQYVRWARQRHDVAREPPAHVADYPSEFLRSRDSLELFKVIQ